MHALITAIAAANAIAMKELDSQLGENKAEITLLDTDRNYGCKVTDIDLAASNPVWAHKVLDRYFATQERFADGTTDISKGRRYYVKQNQDDLLTQIRDIYVSRSGAGQSFRHVLRNTPILRTLVNAYLMGEAAIAGMDACTPMATDYFATRKADWYADEDRLDGDTEELYESMIQAIAAGFTGKLAINALFKRQRNRCELSKARCLKDKNGNLVGWISFKKEWDATKAKMATIGADVRAEFGWAKQVEVELNRREQDTELEDKPLAARQSDGSHKFPTEDAEGARNLDSLGGYSVAPDTSERDAARKVALAAWERRATKVAATLCNLFASMARLG
jgi:hypothetical protein